MTLPSFLRFLGLCLFNPDKEYPYQAIPEPQIQYNPSRTVHLAINVAQPGCFSLLLLKNMHMLVSDGAHIYFLLFIFQ